MKNLLSLKIESGWAITYNKFVDEAPLALYSNENGKTIKNWHWFTEDILQISRMVIDENFNWYLPDERIIIDLGWQPDSRIDGTYTLQLVKVVNSNWIVIEEFKSTNRFLVRDKIEKWIDLLSVSEVNNWSLDKLVQKVFKFETGNTDNENLNRLQNQ